MSDFVKIATLASLAGDGKWMFEIGERLVVLFRVDGQFFCLDDVCTHDGGPLGEGRLEGHFIACPRHGAKFDVRNGQACTMPATEATVSHDVKVDGAFVWVRLRGGGEDATNDVPSATGEVSTSHECCDGHAGAANHSANVVTWNTAAESNGALATDAGSSAGAKSVSCGGNVGVAAAGTAAVGLPVALCEDLVREELKRVIDPELFVNIVDLGLVYNVDLAPGEVGGSKVKIDMTMTSPMCPAGPQLIAQCKQFVGQMSGVDSVEVKIVMDPPWTPAKMSDSARDQLGIF
ncbi:MAG: iron-sulfur cluster assembly protein [Planctomycetota bacterium]